MAVVLLTNWQCERVKRTVTLAGSGCAKHRCGCGKSPEAYYVGVGTGDMLELLVTEICCVGSVLLFVFCACIYTTSIALVHICVCAQNTPNRFDSSVGKLFGSHALTEISCCSEDVGAELPQVVMCNCKL